MSRRAKLLLDLSDYGRQTIQRRQHSIQQMAGRVASVPEAISRTLAYFNKRGLIQSSRATIQVLYPEALANLAQIDPIWLEE